MMTEHDKRAIEAAAKKRQRRAADPHGMRKRVATPGTAASLGIPINPPAPTTSRKEARMGHWTPIPRKRVLPKREP